ncbi:MAG: DUF2304 domain-containing protein, partial [Propionibacteriaceae bacterium]|nr:DUF2304 domain-containing protein [Propionibacteriaceae bacterium]
MTGYWFAVALSVLLLVVLVQLLRHRRVREKYAVLWIVVGLGVAVVAAFPQAAVGLARLVGVEVPSNLVIVVAIFVLLVVCLQLSVAVSQLEERTRVLAEEIALLGARAADQPAGDQDNDPTDPDQPDPDQPDADQSDRPDAADQSDRPDDSAPAGPRLPARPAAPDRPGESDRLGPTDPAGRGLPVADPGRL